MIEKEFLKAEETLTPLIKEFYKVLAKSADLNIKSLELTLKAAELRVKIGEYILNLANHSIYSQLIIIPAQINMTYAIKLQNELDASNEKINKLKDLSIGFKRKLKNKNITIDYINDVLGV